MIHKTVAETGGGRSGEGHTKEVLWLGTIGLSESFFRSFIEEARIYSFAHDAESTIIFVQDGYRNSWKKGLTKSKRSWQSVILDGYKLFSFFLLPSNASSGQNFGRRCVRGMCYFSALA